MAAKGRIEIDAEHCKGCELCTTVCPQDVIQMADWFNAKGYRPAAAGRSQRRVHRLRRVRRHLPGCRHHRVSHRHRARSRRRACLA